MIISVKVQKGGVGKTFISANLAHLLSLITDKKVIILTSDSQNSIYDVFKKEKDENIDLKKGLRNCINEQKIFAISLRKNLDYIPIDEEIRILDRKKTLSFLEILKMEYEYIIIDSSPTLNIDNIFLEVADKIIIPACGDKLTISGIVNILKKERDKVIGIVFNKFSNTKIEREYYKEIKEICNTQIRVYEPIPQWSYLSYLIENGKTIWESKKNCEKLEKVREVFAEICKTLVM